MKLDLIKNQVNTIINSGFVKTIFTVDSIDSDVDCTIDLYLLVHNEQYKVASDYINDLFVAYNTLLFHKKYNYNEYVKASYYYENCININIYYLNDLNIKLYQNVISIYDPNNLMNSFIASKLPYTNLEYANLLNDFSIQIFELYKSILKEDKLLSYNIAINIQNIYVKLYRGFYDSLNAKKEFLETSKTMNKTIYQSLIDRIKLFRYETIFDVIRQYINDIDSIVSKLPITVISLFNIDFYNYTKKLIYTL